MRKTTLLSCLALILSAVTAHAECNESWWSDLLKRGIQIDPSLSGVKPGTPEYSEILRTYRAKGCARSDLDRDIKEALQYATHRNAARSRAMAGDGRFCDRKGARFLVSIWAELGFTPPGTRRMGATYDEALNFYYESGCTREQLDEDILSEPGKTR